MVSEAFKQQLEDYVAPYYATNDPGHDIRHARTVVESTLLFAKHIGMTERETELAVAIAYLHDIRADNRDEHHELSYRHVLTSNDDIFKQFSNAERLLMAIACREHRSRTKQISSKFTMVIKCADRGVPVYKDYKQRAIEYTMHKYNLTWEQAEPEAVNHIMEKYGPTGYSTIPSLWHDLYAKELEAYQAELKADYDRLMEVV